MSYWCRPCPSLELLLPSADQSAQFEANAVGVAGITLAVAILWPKRFYRYLPSPHVALGAGSLVSLIWLTNAPTIGSVPTDLPFFKMPDISFNVLVRSIEPALVIALVGSADTLLTGLVADSMARTRHDPSKELLAQGMDAVFTGFLQGLPGAGATPSTVANFPAGGRTFVSGVIAVALLLIAVLALGDYVALIPNALLAGILFRVALDTIHWRFVTRLHRVQREHMAVMLLTPGLTVFLDLVTAVAVGMIAAAVTHARQFELLELDSVVSVPILDRDFFGNGESKANVDDFSARVGLVALRDAFTVASSSKLLDTVGEDIREHEVVILDFSDTVYVDDSAALVVEQLIETANSNDTHCIVMGLAGSPVHNIQALNVLRRVPQGHIVDSWDEARSTAARLLA